MIKSDRLTAEDLLHMPDSADQRFELVLGELVSMPPPKFDHATTASIIDTLLSLHVRPNRLGAVAVELGCILRRDPDTLRIPDVCFIRAERVAASAVADEYWPGAPDLAVEILSPDDRYREVRDKVAEYLEAGTSLVWVVDPRADTIEIHEPMKPPVILSVGDQLTGGEVLPGFQVSLAELFA